MKCDKVIFLSSPAVKTQHLSNSNDIEIDSECELVANFEKDCSRDVFISKFGHLNQYSCPIVTR